MGIIELFKIGFFTAFWNWSSPIWTALLYFCVAVGIIVQYICNTSLVSIICGALSLSACVVLDALGKNPYLTIGLILLKISGTIGSFAIGGGFEIYMFRKAAKKIK